MFKTKDVFIPRSEVVDNVIQNIRAEILEDGSLSDDIIALVGLMEKNRMIKKYFLDCEKNILKSRLK